MEEILLAINNAIEIAEKNKSNNALRVQMTLHCLCGAIHSGQLDFLGEKIRVATLEMQENLLLMKQQKQN